MERYPSLTPLYYFRVPKNQIMGLSSQLCNQSLQERPRLSFLYPYIQVLFRMSSVIYECQHQQKYLLLILLTIRALKRVP